jgi:hypothetical protein
MFILTSRSDYDDKFTVLDTDDMIEETYSKGELLGILQTGVTIYGTSLFSLENNSELTVVLRLYTDEDVRDFDGFLLRDLPEEQSEYFYQVIDSINEVESLKTYSFLRNLIQSLLPDYNKNLYNLSLLDNKNYGYDLFAYDKASLTLKESKSGELYGCDFYECLFIYLEEKQAINGVAYISLHDLQLDNGLVLSDTDILQSYLDNIGSIDESNKVQNIVKNNIITSANFTWENIDSMIPLYSIKLTDFNFPLYNIKSNIVEGKPYMQYHFVNKCHKVVGFDNVGFIFEDGTLLNYADNVEKIWSQMDALEFKSDDIKLNFINWYNVYVSKCKLMHKDYVESKDLINNSCTFENGSFLTQLGKSHIDLCSQPFVVKTSFGDIEIQGNLEFPYKYLWLTRFTQLGSIGYDFTKSSIIVANMKDFNVCLDNEVFGELINKCILSGVTYYGDILCPVCVSWLNETEDGMEIDIACMISCRADGEWMYKSENNNSYTGYSIVNIPLLNIGSKVIHDGDKYIIKLMCSTLVISDSVMHNLVGTYDKVTAEYSLWNYQESSRPKDKVMKAKDRNIQLARKVLKDASESRYR